MSVCPSVSLMCVRTSVCPSTRRFFDFNDIWHVGRVRLVMHDVMQYDPIQSQGHEPLKVGNPSVFKSYLFCHFSVHFGWTIRRTNVQRRVLCVTLASTTTSLICFGTCTSYGFQKESSFDLPYLLSAVITTRRLRISLTISIGLIKRNHGIDYGPVPAHV